MRGLFMLGLMAASAVLASTGSAQEDTARSSPRDRTFYTRPAIPDDIVRDEPPTDGNVAPAAIAARAQGKYIEMHDALMAAKGTLDEATVLSIAGKVGLSGRAAAIVADTTTGARIEKAAARAGVLVEVTVSPLTRLPIEDNGFDVAIIDDTGASLTQMAADDRAALVRETLRVLRPGGRVMVIGATPRTGLGAKLSAGSNVVSADPTPALQADGYRTVRVLAERDGLIFFEGMKPRA